MPQRGEGLGPLGESQSLSWGPLPSLRCSAFSCWVDFVEFKSQLSFVSPSVATTPCGFLASSFSWTQSPWSPGLSPQGGYGLCSLCTHLAMERVDRDAEAREAPARWSDDQKLKKGHDINRHGECFWCKNRVKGIHPRVPQTQKATGVAPSWGWVNWSGPRGSAKRGHRVCLMPSGLVE